MCRLIIRDDNENERSYILNNYEITVTDDELILTLITDRQTIEYNIRADKRANDLLEIRDFITGQLQESYSSRKPFMIREFLVRMYIFIGDDENCRQFTAHRNDDFC